ncbi:MAG: hypothetical protein WB245_04625 [Acidimicrobiia bacterium]
MADAIEIKGGAGAFEAAVIAVVLDRLSEESRAARQRQGNGSRSLSPWVLAVQPDEPTLPMDIIRPT